MSNVLVGCRGKFVNKRNVVKMVNVWEARTSAKFRKIIEEKKDCSPQIDMNQKEKRTRNIIL